MNLGKNFAISATAALLVLATVVPAQPATASPGAPKPNEVGDLLETYRAWGLPLPPKQAQLVCFDYGGNQDDRGKVTPIFHLAFLLKAAANAEPPLLLVGTLEYRPEAGETKVRPVDAEKVNAKSMSPEWMKPIFEINAGLATALQCQAQGYDRLAAKLLASSLDESSGHHFSTSYQPANLPPKTALAFMAWAHWRNELVLPDTDRTLIARQMHALLTAEPKLGTQANHDLLDDLNAALVPSQAKTGSAESLIDDLVELCYQPPNGFDTPAPRYQKLAVLGFKAVPNLIEHLDDRRLTRAVRLDFCVPPSHLRVGDIVGDLLQGVAGSDLDRDCFRRQPGNTVDQAAVRSWWEKAQRTREEDYLVAHVLPDGKTSDCPNQQMVDIIVRAYPLRLPGLYRQLLDEQPALHSWPLAQAIAASSVPRAEKISLFLYAATNQNLEHRWAALAELRLLDEERFVSILVDNLNAVASIPKVPYWKCTEAALANLVMETDDPRAWKALLAAARRADIGLRMELMQPMNYAYIGQRQRQQRLDFVAAFLNDGSVRDEKSNPVLFDGPYAEFTFTKMKVRNFAAMQIASILGLPDEPEPEWTSAQWSALRAKVGANLRREQKRE